MFKNFTVFPYIIITINTENDISTPKQQNMYFQCQIAIEN